LPTFHLISLGCAKNRVDSEVVLADLLARGFEPREDPDGADLIIVNTCAFIRPAVEEALDHLLQAAQLKRAGRAGRVVALGCLPQRYGRDLVRGLPEVDLFVDAAALDRAGQSIAALAQGSLRARRVSSRSRFLYSSATPRALTSTPGSAFVKIAEGCPNRCAYCTIPAIRGRQKSRSVGDIVKEVTNLHQHGVQEVNLVAQDLTAFGRDLRPRESLAGLLRALEAAAQGPAWIRLLYLNPARLDGELLELLASAGRVLPYLDLPLQHAVPRLIRKMGRRPPGPDLLAWIEGLRERLPGAVLRTSFIVGYPGETEADFEALLDFAARARFDHLGGFVFWPEEGTRAARLPGRVPEEIARARLDLLLKQQQRISLELNRARLGQRLEVLVEGVHPESDLLLAGRVWFQAPEVDGQVIIRAGQGHPGRLQPARVVAAQAYDLVVELKGRSRKAGPAAQTVL